MLNHDSPVMDRRNRITICSCGGKLGADKDAVLSESGFIYRARKCEACSRVVRTKQAPEEVCCVEENAAAPDAAQACAYPV